MGNKITIFGSHQSPNLWDQKQMHKQINFVDGAILRQEMKEFTDIADDTALKINFEYLIYKKIGGVRIETGWLQLKKSSLEQCLSLLNDFLPPSTPTEPKQNLQALSSWAKLFGWELPSTIKCAGYILNRELVRLEEGPRGTCLLFKFKDDGVDIFFLYRVWFLVASDNYFFLIQKAY